MELIHNIPNPAPFPVHELLISQSPNANGSVCTSALISPALQCPKSGAVGTQGLQGGSIPAAPQTPGQLLWELWDKPFPWGSPAVTVLCLCVSP